MSYSLTHSRIRSMAQEFQLEVWDHDTIGVDDEIGCATFTLKDLAERHSHDDVPLVLILRTSKCSPAASRYAYRLLPSLVGITYLVVYEGVPLS